MVRGDVLVVDDDADGRDALSQLLAARGYEVRQAGNGRTALEMIAERPPAYLVLDLEMPVMSGWEVIAALELSSAPCAFTVVVLSAEASSPSGVTCLQKPCVLSELLAVLGAPWCGPEAEAPSARPPPAAPRVPAARGRPQR